MERERICNPKALDWILQEVSRVNHSVRGDVRQFVTSGDFPSLIKEYNMRHDEGIRLYSVEEADLYARMKTQNYIKELQRKKVMQ